MSTMPTSMPGYAGQTGLPGNTGNTVSPNYSFLPSAPKQMGSGTSQGSSSGSAIPTYTANNFSDPSTNNPFSSYTGFNLGMNSADEMTKMYGPLGTAMYYYLNNGAGYNPAVLNNLVNQIQPQVQRDLSTLGSTAGMTGNRFGSAYQLGTADYLSQVNQNELNMASSLYQQSQNTINSDMMNMLSGAGQYQSNKGGTAESWISALLPALTGMGNSSGGLLGSLLQGFGINLGGSGNTGINTTPTTFPSGSTASSSGGTLSGTTASIQDMINILGGITAGGEAGNATGGIGGGGDNGPMPSGSTMPGTPGTFPQSNTTSNLPGWNIPQPNGVNLSSLGNDNLSITGTADLSQLLQRLFGRVHQGAMPDFTPLEDVS